MDTNGPSKWGGKFKNGIISRCRMTKKVLNMTQKSVKRLKNGTGEHLEVFGFLNEATKDLLCYQGSVQENKMNSKRTGNGSSFSIEIRKRPSQCSKREGIKKLV